MKIISKSPERTLKTAAEFARLLKKGDIVFLKGDLGAGKTVFVKGILKKLKLSSYAPSPTFNIIKKYSKGALTAYHIDLYRLSFFEEIEIAGILNLFDGKHIVLIEWPEILEENMNIKAKNVTLKHLKKINEREIKWTL